MRDVRRRLLAPSALPLFIAVCASLVTTTPALAAAPPNDNFANAEALTGTSDMATGTNVEATKETGEPYHVSNPGGASVWYTWTVPTTGKYALNTCGSDFDTLLAVYRGNAVDTLSWPDAGNDQSFGARCPDSDQSEVILYGNAGTTYRIAVDGYAPESTYSPARGQVVLNLEPATPPGNDAFASSELLTGSADSATGTNRYATRETGEPYHADGGGGSVWYSWTAPAAGKFRVDTCASNFPTALGVYTGTTVNALSQVASNGGGCGGLSRVVFAAAGGVTYRIAVDGENFDPSLSGAPWMGDIDLNLRPASPPPNDDKANAQVLTGSSAVANGTNLDASVEPGELTGFPGGASVWYRWTAGAAGPVAINACGSTFDTTLWVGKVGAPPGWGEAANDDSPQCQGPQSFAQFQAVGGQEYLILLDGYQADEGDLHLVLTHTPWSGTGGPPPGSAPNGPTNVQQARALKKCKKKSGRARRRCKAKVRRKFGLRP